MLPVKPVEEATLELIKSLQSKSYLKDFYLVGGTALAIHLNHRRSIDIDLFCNFDFDVAALREKIQHDYDFQIFFTAQNTLKGSVSDVNVDVISHRYKLIDPPLTTLGIHHLSIPDIIAMKLNAIISSGQRSKDFIDIYYLLNEYPLGSMVRFFLEKYDQKNESIILKSLVYFQDTDLADWPLLIKDPKLKWHQIKKRLEKAVFEYSRKR